MKFLLDQCVPNSIGIQLRNAGHEAILLRECLVPTANDRAVLAKAIELGAALVTLNGDFADITAYPPACHRGIVALQIKNRPTAVAQIVERLLHYLQTNQEITGTLLLVEAHRIRIRS